ncbi:uncharacterized protein RAG0_06483 [Rhynchosporium agropyri]|uniref:Uncharacterized protein n=1 Tax=Rhynchosporium agropyri TaxID=914238 RepID=A0A1E1KH71_9HELO|nr:uncharacterized protein RAG0_06483 [Rhynchosporium agropyri]
MAAISYHTIPYHPSIHPPEPELGIQRDATPRNATHYRDDSEKKMAMTTIYIHTCLLALSRIWRDYPWNVPPRFHRRVGWGYRRPLWADAPPDLFAISAASPGGLRCAALCLSHDEVNDGDEDPRPRPRPPPPDRKDSHWVARVFKVGSDSHLHLLGSHRGGSEGIQTKLHPSISQNRLAGWLAGWLAVLSVRRAQLKRPAIPHRGCQQTRVESTRLAKSSSAKSRLIRIMPFSSIKTNDCS